MKKEKTLSERRNEILDEVRKSMTGFLLDSRMDYLIRILNRMLKERDKEFIEDILEEIKFVQEDPYDGFDGQIFDQIEQIIKQKLGFEE